ncbi:hypothetical protein CUN00_13070 [Enterococcus faecalis]|nr:hypothetical protein CUN00_13070 [Enterococcus faecalis]
MYPLYSMLGVVMETEQLTFKQRMIRSYIDNAQVFKEFYVNKSYLLYASSCKRNAYYILEAKPSNYYHLTGAKTNLTADEFWNKCYSKTLNEEDIIEEWKIKPYLEKTKDQMTIDEKERAKKIERNIKGTIRNKLFALDKLSVLMNTSNLEIQENYQAKNFFCKLAISEVNITIGYTGKLKLYPKSLLKSNKLKSAEKIDVELLLVKDRNDTLFTDILFGDLKEIKNHLIIDLLDENLMVKLSD